MTDRRAGSQVLRGIPEICHMPVMLADSLVVSSRSPTEQERASPFDRINCPARVPEFPLSVPFSPATGKPKRPNLRHEKQKDP